MGAKHYQKLGKTKLVRIPEGAVAFCQELCRIVDTKENPWVTMEGLKAIAKGQK